MQLLNLLKILQSTINYQILMQMHIFIKKTFKENLNKNLYILRNTTGNQKIKTRTKILIKFHVLDINKPIKRPYLLYK